MSINASSMGASATYRCADLDVEFANWVPVVHGIEGGDLIHTHRRHFEYPCYFVHDADACEAVLALAKVEQRHNGGLLILRGVPGDDLLDKLLILRGEFERDRRVVLGCITML